MPRQELQARPGGMAIPLAGAPPWALAAIFGRPHARSHPVRERCYTGARDAPLLSAAQRREATSLPAIPPRRTSCPLACAAARSTASPPLDHLAPTDAT